MMRQWRSLQALRATAAILVVLFHVDSVGRIKSNTVLFDGMFHTGDRGVDLFFVLSGFLITTVHWGDIGRPRNLLRYCENRARRIYPAVIIMTGLALVMYMMGVAGAEKAAEKLQPWSIVASFLLLPQSGEPLVNVTWTLKYELAFYAIFAVLIYSRIWGLAIISLWQGATLVSFVTGMELTQHYLRPIVLDFGIGMLTAALISKGDTLRPGVWLVLAAGGATMFVIGMSWTGEAAGSLCAFGSAFAIAGLVRSEDHGLFEVHPVINRLGDASYGIYMVHYSAITLAYMALLRLGIEVTTQAGLALAAFGIVAGVLFDGLIDKPIQRRSRSWLRRLTSGSAISASEVATEPAATPKRT